MLGARLKFVLLFTLMAASALPGPMVNRTFAEESPDNIVRRPVDDPRLKAAADQAQETLPRFITMIVDKPDGRYSVKFPMIVGSETEHIWLEVQTVQDDEFTGVLGNDSIYSADLTAGTPMTVKKDQVEDWMAAQGDDLYGGYSVRVIFEDMPKDQADALRARLKD